MKRQGISVIRRASWAVTVGLAVCVIAAGCAATPPPALPAPHTGGLDPDGAAQAGVAAYATAGRYAAGVTTVEIQPGRKMEVWYPAPKAAAAGASPDTYHIRDFLAPALRSLLPASVNPPFVTDGYRDLPAAPGGPFPLVLFSHGASSYRLQSTALTTHLASWGFVVVSPDYFERGIQSLGGTPPAPGRTNSQIAQMALDKAIELDASGNLAGRIDTTRLFPIGHSAGGSESTELAGTRTDVQSWISMSSGVSLEPSLFNPSPSLPPSLADPDKTVMWITGQDDGVARLSTVRKAFDFSAGEKKLVIVPLSGHNNAMTDICEIGRDQGGLTGLAQRAGLPLPGFVVSLARDGCSSPPFYLGPQVWPVVRHFVTAELRYRSGLDPEPVGLGSGVVDRFGAIVPTYQHVE